MHNPFSIDSSNEPSNEIMLFRDKSASNKTVGSGYNTSNLSKVPTKLLWSLKLLITDAYGIMIFIGRLSSADLVWDKYNLDKLDSKSNFTSFVAS